MFRKWVLFAAIWAFGLIVLGAYVRLSDAGLGCPDWPGCYGKLSPAHAASEIHAAVSEAPNGYVSMGKAWREMIHRYFASGLGLVVLSLFIAAMMMRDKLKQSLRLPGALVLVICLQGALGMWTVTLLLKPAIVTAHLLGGLATLILLVWWALKLGYTREHVRPVNASIRPWALLALGCVVLQIALGGWVSTNYAALACTDFPTCQGALVPPMAFGDAFHLFRELGQTADGRPLDMANMTGIHWLHRVGALITTIAVLNLVWRLHRAAALPRMKWILVLALVLQVSLGIANVLLRLPLPVAVMHNAGAGLLLVLMVIVNFRLAAASKEA
ncbi:COX15/CtaA family protein [Burkholderiaceae bacterium DAT-1]|nr:COX15/CtaA family protein [Burkholderiaceae bacterium DAT-1]